ncbi:MAG: DUF1572 domain-containing protein [Acidobacteriota bacterium]|nr:DUF1572 domain-containing protein [Acidobacteriota bacterium]
MAEPASDAILAGYLPDALKRLRGHKKLAERAIEQVADADFFRTLDPEGNSIALLVKHVAGNMRSRFTDFLTTDGDKPDRGRDREFLSEGETREDLSKAWDRGWELAFSALEPLSPADLGRTIRINAEPHTVLAAINRHLAHFAYHAGQIVFLAKHLAGPRWKTLSIARGESQAWNDAMRQKAEQRA